MREKAGLGEKKMRCDLCLESPCVKGCPNYDEDQEGFILCPSCDVHLHNGDVWYPEFDICEFCLKEHEKIVEVEDEED